MKKLPETQTDDINGLQNIRICKLQGCNNPLTDMRADAEFCNPKHKSQFHNKIRKILLKDQIEWQKNDLHNYRILEKCLEKCINKLTVADTKLLGFHLNHCPRECIHNNTKVAIYNDIVLWLNNDNTLEFVKT